VRLTFLTTLALISGLITAPAASAAAATDPPAPLPERAAAAPPADSSSRQMITVSATSSSATQATLTAWQKNASGQWKAVIGPVTAWVGSGGIGTASEGSTRTPKGTWSLAQAFGRQPDPGTALPYFKTDSLDWWNGNVNSAQYNTHVRQTNSPGGASENLYYAGSVYNYAAVIGYNLARTPGAGSAFFLHVSGGEPTAGCVSIPSATLVKVLKWLKPASKPVIRIGIGVGAPKDDPVVEGSYIRSSTSKSVYRIVGGAPVHVSSWAALGTTQQPTRTMTPAQIHALPQYPKDGTYIRVRSSGNVYRVIGGAPLPLTDWSYFGGQKATLYVDPAAIVNAGTAPVWNHLRQYPKDGTTLKIGGSGSLYRVAGGAPIYISSTKNISPNITPFTTDPKVVTNGGKGDRWNHLRQIPISGTFIVGWTSKKIYRVIGGVPKRVDSWSKYGGVQPFTYVDQSAVDHHGQAGAWRHLL